MSRTTSKTHELSEKMDAIVRPYIAATRDDAPDDAALATLSLLAFPRPTFERPERPERPERAERPER